MGEVDAVMPDKSDTSEQISTINGEMNGICSKTDNNTMEVDTEDDSQLSSSENGTATTDDKDLATTVTTTDKIINKNNLVVNNIDYLSSNSNSSSTSTNNDSSSNLKQNLATTDKTAVTTTTTTTTKTTTVSTKITDSLPPASSSLSSSTDIITKNDLKDIDENSSIIDDSSQNTADDSSEECKINKENGSIEKCQIEQQSEQTTESESTSDSTDNKLSIVTNKNETSNNSNDDKIEAEEEDDDDEDNDDDDDDNDSHKTEESNKKTENEEKKINDTKNDENKNDVLDQSNIDKKSKEADTEIEKTNEKVIPMEIDSNSKNASFNTAVVENKKKEIEEDDAVIIPSDSDSEPEDNSKINDISKQKQHQKPEESKDKKEIINNKIVDDDVVEVLSDKDDCVVIEDDDDDNKKDNTNIPRRTARQRKNIKTRNAFDDDGLTDILDDSQPPSKRARTEPQTVGQIGQITIKDARSLLSSQAMGSLSSYQDNSTKQQQQNFNQSVSQASGAKGTKESTLVIIDTNSVMQQHKISSPTKSNVTGAYMPAGISPQAGIFPVNIRAAGLSPISSTTPPKPVSTTVSPTVQNFTTLPDTSSILPNLTDDMFVLEAPSFIVPYIYEKPPTENLKEVVTKLSVEVETPEKDNKDEKNEKINQSATEENAANTTNEETTSKKDKKKRKKPKNPDDSWGESDESTDDDASDAETRTKILIKEIKTTDITSIVTDTEALKQSILGGSGKEIDKRTENYFESPLGKFFIDIGIGLVQEYVQADLLKQQKRKRDKARGGNTSEIERAINSLKSNLQDSKKRNEPFKFEMKRCKYCNFKSESALAMAHHYETPHMRQYMYKCNFCSFEVRPPHDILFHMEAVHNIKGRLEKAPSYHQCPNCPFEDNGKSKLARHMPVCAKKFRPEQNLLPPSDWEAPAKIPRIKPRHGLVGTATAYQAMAAQAAAQKAALASLSQQQQHQQQQQQQQRGLAPNNNAAVNNAFMRNRGRPQGNTNRQPVPVAPTNSRVRQVSPGGVVMPNLHMTGGQFIQVSGSNMAILPNSSHNTLALQQQQNTKKGGNGQPSISITPLPRQTNNQTISNPISMQSASITPASGSKSTSTGGLKPGQSPSGNKASFVICEICDGYIKDLEQLRNHMQWMHKVKIHPKMIYNRPPLNCQKCQFRFFTDQGLERHLLGSHGLVTSSMQEAANKGKDAGRCPVCGRMYQWKLLNHVSRDHHMTLKPAHLSYKCTVCTATFGMYKQFENHVYTAHSTVAKKAMDNKKNSGNSGNNMPSGSNNNSGSNQRGSTSVSNFSSLNSGDTLLKPLKINDEITIIPQPVSKSRSAVNEIESHIIGRGGMSSSFSGYNSFSGVVVGGGGGVSGGFGFYNANNSDVIEEISDDDEDDSDYVTLSNGGTKKKVWSLDETKHLIECYKKYRHFLEQKSFKKDDLWLLITEEMNKNGFKNSPNQAKFKFDKLKRTYIKAKRRNRKTKYKPRAFHFMEEFDELFSHEEEKRIAEKTIKIPPPINITIA